MELLPMGTLLPKCQGEGGGIGGWKEYTPGHRLVSLCSSFGASETTGTVDDVNLSDH